MRWILLILRISLILVLLVPCYGQEKNRIQGWVLDDSTHLPIENVNIFIQNSVIGAQSDRSGFFELSGDLSDSMIVVFSHVGYYRLVLELTAFSGRDTILLKRRPLSLEEVLVMGERKVFTLELPINKDRFDLDNLKVFPVSTIGEFLQSNSSILIESPNPVRQLVSIRGANPDETLVVLDGVPVNNTFNNEADLSWIPIENITTIEVQKGAQAASYGPGVIGGVVNIKTLSPERSGLKLSACVGNQRFHSEFLKLGFRQGGVHFYYGGNLKNIRVPADIAGKDYRINSNYNHFNLGLDTPEETLKSRLTLLSFYRQMEDDDNENYTRELKRFLSTNLKLSQPFLGNLAIQVTKSTNKQNDRFVYYQGVDLTPIRVNSLKSKEELTFISVSRPFLFDRLELLLKGDLLDNRFSGENGVKYLRGVIHTDVENRVYQRRILGANLNFSYRGMTGMEVLPVVEFNMGVRRDVNVTEGEVKRSTYFGGGKIKSRGDYTGGYRLGIELSNNLPERSFRLFYVNGRNSRIASLYDYYLNSITTIVDYLGKNIAPEKVFYYELGLEGKIPEVNRVINQWNYRISLFKNSYVDKIYYLPIVRSTPVALNQDVASISGYDFSLGSWLFNQVLRMKLTVLWLSISNTLVFPNKPVTKYIIELEYLKKRCNFLFRYISEGNQTGLGRLPGGFLVQRDLKAERNIDIVLNYRLPVREYNLVVSILLLNLLSEEMIDGIPSYYLGKGRLIQFRITFDTL